jgi:hypothetical protein
MFKRFTAAIVALVLGVALSLVGSTAAQAQLLSQSVAAPCTPSAATTIHHDAVSRIDYQRYSYNPKGDHPDNPNEANPASTPASDPPHWTANTTNWNGEDTGVYVQGHGNDTDNGSWFYWTKNVIVTNAYDVVVPAVTCSDATISGSSLSAICDGTPVYTEAQFAIVNATWDTAIDNTVGTHARGATATAGQLFASTTSNIASLSYTVPASLGTTQSTDSEAACYTAPSTVTYETIVWSMPPPNTGTASTYPQQGVSQHKGETVQTLEVAVPTTCGTQYQVDVYLQTNGETDNTTKLDELYRAGLTGPDGAQDGEFLAGYGDNPGTFGLGYAWKFVKNADCVTTPPPTVQACTTYGSVVSHDLADWNTSDTRATGHYQVTADGLHIYTEGATSTDKVAAYYSTSFALANAGTKTVGDSLDYAATFGTAPGLQQVVDFNNDGTPDGILVGETVYGGTDWWLNNSGTLPGSPTLPAAMTTGGSGSARHGTLNDWLALYPAARVLAVGFSLGSGVYGDGYVNRITLGCVDYTFVPAVDGLTPVSAGDPTNTGETCSTSGLLVGGVITVIPTANVDYVITDSSENVVPFNEMGETGPLTNGTYTVAVTAADGYRLTSPSSYSLTVSEHDGECVQLIDHPIVTPIVTSSEIGCATDGSYTLSNDLSAADGVIWSVDGSPVLAGTYQVTSAGTVNVHANPNGPTYGFGDGQQRDFTLTFARPASCDLKTLALHDGTLASTGTNPTGLLVLAGFLALFGLALMRRARRMS